MPTQLIDLRKIKDQIRHIPEDKQDDKLRMLLKSMEEFCAGSAKAGDAQTGMFATFTW